jgi:hypothetical protein
MGKIFFYTKMAIGLIVGFPIVLVILFIAGVNDAYHKLTCEKCKKYKNENKN